MESSEKGQTTTSSNQASQQFSSSNQSAQVDLLPMFQTPLAVNWGSQNWLSADRNLAQTGMQVPVPVILGSHQFFSMVNPSIQIKPSYRSLTPMPTSVGLDQLSSTNRQVLGTQSSLNIRPSMSANLASHPSSSISKRPTQIRAPPKVQSIMPMNMGSQLSTNNRPAQLVLRQKVQSESFESVRSKLRESLASSLVMVSDQQNKEQIAEKSILGDASTTVAKVATPVGELNPEAKNTSSDKCAPETLISDGSAPKLEEVQSVASDTSSKENTTCSTVLTRSDAEKLQPNHISLQEEVPNDNTFVKDELLQGHGLCWVSDLDVETVDDLANHDRKRLKMANEHETADKETTVKNAEHLAFRIEAELFRLFGGVNKKYKEKGRSLLFNLKDRSNPELRERVLSGVIAPERLCTMTTEELASKELSQWRLAKAEELAQMVVLPDSDVDLRRVKKTHKGEFQVEVEQAESFPVEVELGTSVLSQVPPKPNEEVKRQSKSNLKSDQPKASDRRSSARKIASGDQNLPADIEILHEKTDLMQELMVDEVKDPELLPPIVSLDEFMQALDSEPPFENLSVDSLQEVPSSGVEKLDSEPEKVPASDSVQHKQDVASGSLGSKSDSSQDGSSSKLGLSQDSMQPKLGFPDATLKDPATVSPDKVDMKCSRNDDNLNSGSVNIQSDTCPPEVVSTSDKIWEGLIQLNISAVATVIGFFRSGEKTSTQEWPSFLEIKGRVRLDAFEKFLKELPLSRSRAIMIAQFCWKDGSNEGGRLNLLEIIDSYVADERVGYAEPAPGVELYFCPRHSRMTEMLEKCLPKEHAETFQMTFDGLIGVVVWRRPHVMISPRMSSHHKHGSSKKQLSSRKQQSIGSYPASKSSVTTVPAGTPAANAQPPPEDDTDDVPPGFGPRDDDDLPEFDFVHGSSRPSKRATSTRPHVLPARPVDQIRELIHKYGQSENVKKPSIDIQPWNDNDDDDEDDDIPEWRPQDDRQLQAQALPPPSLPPPPPSLPLPLPLPPQLHTYQQQTLQPLHINQQILSKPHHINQQILSMPPQHLSSHPQVPLQHPVPMAALPPMALQQPPLPPQIAVLPAPLNMPSPRWQQQSPLLPLAGGPVMQTSHYNAQPNVDGQMYSMPPLGAAQNVMGWRPDVFGNRGGA